MVWELAVAVFLGWLAGLGTVFAWAIITGS